MRELLHASHKTPECADEHKHSIPAVDDLLDLLPIGRERCEPVQPRGPVVIEALADRRPARQAGGNELVVLMKVRRDAPYQPSPQLVVAHDPREIRPRIRKQAKHAQEPVQVLPRHRLPRG